MSRAHSQTWTVPAMQECSTVTLKPLARRPERASGRKTDLTG